MPRRISPSLVVSGIALVLAAGGIGMGAGAFITGADIQDGSITGADIRDGSITTRELARGAVSMNRMAPAARLALRKAGTPGPAGAAGAAGPQGAEGPRGAGGSGSAGGLAETFTQAGPITVASGGAREAFAFDRAVAWITPESSIDTVYVTAKVTAPAVCSAGDRRIGMRLTVDGAVSQPWYESIFYVIPGATSSFGDVVTTLGPGSHAITGFEIESATPGCTVTVTDILLGVARTS